MTIEGDINFGPYATLETELAGLVQGTSYDFLNVTGTATLGGTLNVVLLNGFAPQVNNTFDLLDWGSISGAFASVKLPLQNGATPLRWDGSQLYVNGQIKLVSASASVVSKTIYWKGDVDDGSGHFRWDVGNTTNWTDSIITERFFNGDTVVLNDSLAVNRNVTVNAAVSPASVTVSNAAGNDFTISGTGSIGGPSAAVVKNGAGKLTLATANSYGGGTTVGGGTLVVGNAGALGTGGLSISGAAVTQLQAGLSGPVQLASLTISSGSCADRRF